MDTPTTITMTLTQIYLVSMLSVFLLGWMVTFAWLSLRKAPEPQATWEDASSPQVISAMSTAPRLRAITPVPIHAVPIHAVPAPYEVSAEALLERSLS